MDLSWSPDARWCIPTPADVDRVLLVARESARQAGEIIRVAFDQPKRIDSKKNDVRAEQCVGAQRAASLCNRCDALCQSRPTRWTS